MEVEILSKEFIKPWSSTPIHLKIYKLSSLDQTLQRQYLPVYSFYDQNICSPQERCQRHKSSLSQLLTLYYPFAGTFCDRSSILCDDHGVPFTHTIANTTISTLLHNLDLHLLHKLAPDQTEMKTDMVKVQVTDFPCGGFVISLLISHVLSHGISMSIFGRSWAILCRDQDYTSEVMTKLRPDFSGAIHFPPADHVSATTMMVPHMPPFIKQGKLRVRLIVFGPSAIGGLRKKAASVPKPSKTEVVSGLLSMYIISALEARSGSKCGANISHMVNLRQRAEPQFPIKSTGNYLWPAMMVRVGDENMENDLKGLVREARKATSKINRRLVERLRARGSEKVLEELEKVHSGAPTRSEFIQITSTCHFGYYENDFGWGKPVWVHLIGPPVGECTVFMNLVVLTDTTTGDGVDALVFVDEQDMAFLEGSQELQAYAEFDQDPLTNTHSVPLILKHFVSARRLKG